MNLNEKKMDAQMDQILKERDHYFEQAEALKDRLQELLGVDFGEHSSSNCPLQNAIEYDDSHLVLINKSAVSVLYQDAEEPENFTHDLNGVAGLVNEHELYCEGIVQIDCITTANISKKHLYCIHEMKADGSGESEFKMCDSIEDAEKILSANMDQINQHIAEQCESYLAFAEQEEPECQK